MLIHSLGLIVGCAMLAWGANRFVLGACGIAYYFNIPTLIIGVTLVGFATSFPEILVSLLAAKQGKGDIALGNALGSYIANIGLGLGTTALITPLKVHSRFLKRELPLLATTLLFVWFLLRDGQLTQWDGALMLVGFFGLILFMGFLAIYHQSHDDALTQEFQAHTTGSDISPLKALLFLLLGLITLYLSSHLLIYSAANIARALGVSHFVIGLTVVAVGTSLPELAASTVSALKGEHDIAIGNIIGSNMLGILAVTAMPGLFDPGPISPWVLWRDLPVMAGITLILFMMCRGFTSKTHYTLNRLNGIILLSSFIAYTFWVYWLG